MQIGSVWAHDVDAQSSPHHPHCSSADAGPVHTHDLPAHALIQSQAYRSRYASTGAHCHRPSHSAQIAHPAYRPQRTPFACASYGTHREIVRPCRRPTNARFGRTSPSQGPAPSEPNPPTSPHRRGPCKSALQMTDSACYSLVELIHTQMYTCCGLHWPPQTSWAPWATTQCRSRAWSERLCAVVCHCGHRTA